MSIELVRDAFAYASGFMVAEARMHNVGNANMLEFSGIDTTGNSFHYLSDPFYGDPTNMARSMGLTEKHKTRIMGKPTSLAQRIAQTKKHIEDQSDALALKLDALDKKIPEAFGHADHVISQHSGEVDAMDAEMRQLSNLPK